MSAFPLRLESKIRFKLTINSWFLTWLICRLTSHSTIFQLYICMWWRTEDRPTVRLPCHRHFVGFLNLPVQAPTRGQPFNSYSEKSPPSQSPLRSVELLKSCWSKTCQLLSTVIRSTFWAVKISTRIGFQKLEIYRADESSCLNFVSRFLDSKYVSKV